MSGAQNETKNDRLAEYAASETTGCKPPEYCWAPLRGKVQGPLIAAERLRALGQKFTEAFDKPPTAAKSSPEFTPPPPT